MSLMTLTYRGNSIELTEPLALTSPAKGYTMPEGLQGLTLGLARLYANYGETIEDQCRVHELELAAALAVMQVEAGGVGAYDSATDLAVVRVEARPPILDRKRYPHGEKDFEDKYGLGQRAEWKALAYWYSLEGETACYWTSFGLGQIMGFNYEFVNCADPVHVMLRAQSSAVESAKMFFDFVNAKKLIEVLRSKDWLAFADGYNDPGNAQGYAEKIAVSYDSAISLLK